MKFSSDTIAVLKNFATINPSIIFKPGQELKTIHPQKTIMAVANIAETVVTKAAVYDLSRFLASISLLDDADIEFGSDRFKITGGKSAINYTYAAENLIMSAPDKNITVPSPEATVLVKWKDLDSVIKAAGVLQLPELAFVSDGTTIVLSAVDSKNPTADMFSVTVAETGTWPDFNMKIKVDNIRLLPYDYTVALSSKGLAEFKSEKVTYFIALEAK